MFLLIISTTQYISLESNFLILILPYFTYPVVHIAATASTIMTVAIAHERYLAVQAPIVYSQMLKRASAQRRRLAIYLLPVFLFSILFNIPTFWCVENTCRSTEQKFSTNDSAIHTHNGTIIYDRNTTIMEDNSVGYAPENNIYNTNPTTMLLKDVISIQTSKKASYSTVSLVGKYIAAADQESSHNEKQKVYQRTMTYDSRKLEATTTDTSLPGTKIAENSRNSRMISTSKNTSDTGCGNETLTYQYTKFRKHPYFIMFYQNLARLIVLGIIPFAMLIFFNCSIYRAIRRKRGKIQYFIFTYFVKSLFKDVLCRLN